MDAKNAPVNKPGKEVSSADIKVGQRASVNLDLPREAEVIDPIDIELEREYVAALAFNEDPVTILIAKSNEKFAPNVCDCWVNGRGAEQLQNGKWMVCGWLPVGVPVITKRKYAEVLLRAKPEAVQTEVIKHQEREDNVAHRFASNKYPVQILKDESPLAMAWLTKVQMEG